MDMDFLSNFACENEEEKKAETKKGLLKFLKQIGVDARFVSFYQKGSISDDFAIDNNLKLYIENLRFSKFSRRRTDLFNKYYPNIEVIRSSLFQKICLKASKNLANELNPKDTVLLPKIETGYDELLFIVMEPYSRKYGIRFIEYDENIDSTGFDSAVSPLNLNQEVNHILNDIFKGKGIEWNRKFDLSDCYDLNLDGKDIVFPFINVPEEWINDFLEIEKEYEIDYDNEDIAESFMGFLSEINPQFKDNVLAASSFLESHQK